MIQHLATILKEKLEAENINFIDKLAGLVVVAEKTQPTDIEGAFAVSRFPISIDSNYDDCINKGCFKDLVPNSTLKSVIYFEDFGTTPINRNKGYFDYKSKLRLVCWLNNKLIQGDVCTNISHLLITQIRATLETGYFNANNISKIRVVANNIVSNDYKLFERYTYPKDLIKYIMHPYEAFGIDFIVEYSISENCLPDLVLNPELC